MATNATSKTKCFRLSTCCKSIILMKIAKCFSIQCLSNEKCLIVRGFLIDSLIIFIHSKSVKQKLCKNFIIIMDYCLLNNRIVTIGWSWLSLPKISKSVIKFQALTELTNYNQSYYYFHWLRWLLHLDNINIYCLKKILYLFKAWNRNLMLKLYV